MKYISIILLYLCLLWQNSAEASTIDSLLVKGYQANNEFVRERIIEGENLADSLTGNSYCSLYTPNIWSIVVKKEKSFVLYYGFLQSKIEMVRKELPTDDSILIQLFSLDQNNLKEPISKAEDVYTPFWWYFVLTDSLHINKFEWSENTRTEDKYAINCLGSINRFIGYLFAMSYKDL